MRSPLLCLGLATLCAALLPADQLFTVDSSCNAPNRDVDAVFAEVVMLVASSPPSWPAHP